MYEFGRKMGTFGSYTTTDVLRVQVKGRTVQYLKGGVVFYTSTRTVPTFPLVVDISIYDEGAGYGFEDVHLTGMLGNIWHCCKFFENKPTF